jgi:hypothetical protein
MKFLSAIILLTVAVAMADKDEDDWNFYKVKKKQFAPLTTTTI